MTELVSSTDLEHQAFRALADADAALAHLLSAMSFGEENVNTYAYAVKSRIKSPSSLATKVEKKIAAGKSGYAVTSVTDIIGVRILCLWPNDLIAATLWLLRFIERRSTDEVDSVFSGPSLDDSVDEVIVYTAATSTAPVYKEAFVRVRASFASRLPPSKLNNVNAQPDRNYSSIHIVATLRHYRNGIARNYKVEFQIRTALEDVWAEMDHRLFYKGDESLSDRPEIKLGRRMMLMQKQFVDATSVTTDDIRQACESASDGALNDRYAQAVGLEVSLATAGFDNASERAKDAFGSLQVKMGVIYDKLACGLQENKLDLSPKLISDFRAIIDELNQFAAIYSEPDAGTVDSDRARFFVTMEKALAFFWIARLYKSGASAKADGPNGVSQSMDERLAVTSCLECYTYLTEDPAFANSAFLWFRLAQAQMELLNDESAATEAIERARTLLADDDTLPEKSQFRVLIPRMSTFFRWMEYEKLSVVDLRSGAISENARQVLLGVVGDTFALDGMDIEEGATRGSFDPGMDRAKTVNNWINYAVKYVEGGGTWAPLEAIGIDQKRFKAGMIELEKICGDRLDQLPWALHTLTVGYALVKQPRASEFAGRLITALDAGLGVDADDRLWADTMRSDAENVIGG